MRREDRRHRSAVSSLRNLKKAQHARQLKSRIQTWTKDAIRRELVRQREADRSNRAAMHRFEVIKPLRQELFNRQFLQVYHPSSTKRLSPSLPGEPPQPIPQPPPSAGVGSGPVLEPGPGPMPGPSITLSLQEGGPVVETPGPGTAVWVSQQIGHKIGLNLTRDQVRYVDYVLRNSSTPQEDLSAFAKNIAQDFATRSQTTVGGDGPSGDYLGWRDLFAIPTGNRLKSAAELAAAVIGAGEFFGMRTPAPPEVYSIEMTEMSTLDEMPSTFTKSLPRSYQHVSPGGQVSVLTRRSPPAELGWEFMD